MRRLVSVPVYFGFRIASGLLLLKLSASRLSVHGFTVFSQLMLFAALLSLVAVAGMQNGLIRQAAAARDTDALARTQAAAFLVWALGAPVLAVLALAAGRPISELLVGEATSWPIVVAIVLLAVAAGPGQIWCSLLSGRTRVGASLSAQALGLAASTGGAAWFIVRGQPSAATLAFVCGGLVMTAAAFLLSLRLRIPLARPRAAMSEVPILLRYSAAFAATTGAASLILFGLRAVYRAGFGAAALGYWMAANRISDLSTQLMGLVMIQIVAPQLAMTPNEADRRRLLVRWAAAGALAMGSILAVFSMAARPLVHVFLSDAFLPAIPAIQAYMTGDVLRVWPSLAMYAAFARGRPGDYAGIEIGTLATMAAITLALIAAGQPQAPLLGYVGAYALAAVLVSAAFIRRPRTDAMAA